MYGASKRAAAWSFADVDCADEDAGARDGLRHSDSLTYPSVKVPMNATRALSDSFALTLPLVRPTRRLDD
jgi:hypothetical protein